MIATLLALSFSTDAMAQATPVAPFVGEWSAPIEGFPGGVFVPCLSLAGGDLCSEGGSMHATSSWGFMCSIMPYAGSQLAASAGGAAYIQFDEPVSRFGGYFGTNSGTDVVATFEFLNSSGAVVATAETNLGACGRWTWQGWEFSAEVTKVRMLNSTGAAAPSHLMVDNFEVDNGPVSSLDLTFDGTCRGDGRFTLTGATPRGQIALVSANAAGAFALPGGPCAGAATGLSSAGFALRARANADLGGVWTMAVALPPVSCGAHVQAIDLTTCEMSEVIVLD